MFVFRRAAWCGDSPCRGAKARYIWFVSFATGVTCLKQMTIVAWALAVWAFTFSFNFNLNMEVSMIAHVDMFGVAAALWSLVGRLQSTQRWHVIDNSEARRDAAVGVRFPLSTQFRKA